MLFFIIITPKATATIFIEHLLHTNHCTEHFVPDPSSHNPQGCLHLRGKVRGLDKWGDLCSDAQSASGPAEEEAGDSWLQTAPSRCLLTHKGRKALLPLKVSCSQLLTTPRENMLSLCCQMGILIQELNRLIGPSENTTRSLVSLPEGGKYTHLLRPNTSSTKAHADISVRLHQQRLHSS